MSDTWRTESPLYKHKMNTEKHMRTSKQVYSVATQQGVCIATIATRRHNARKIKACSNACSNAERHHDHTKNVHEQHRRKNSTPDTLNDREKQYLACPPIELLSNSRKTDSNTFFTDELNPLTAMLTAKPKALYCFL